MHRWLNDIPFSYFSITNESFTVNWMAEMHLVIVRTKQQNVIVKISFQLQLCCLYLVIFLIKLYLIYQMYILIKERTTFSSLKNWHQRFLTIKQVAKTTNVYDISIFILKSEIFSILLWQSENYYLLGLLLTNYGNISVWSIS